jgi:phage tail-like protein
MVVSDPYQVFSFLIEIDGLVVGGFSECSGLAIETEIFEYREGGLNEYMHSFVGSTKYTPLVLKRGLATSDELWKWYQEVITQGVNLSRVKRRSGTVYLLNQQRNSVKAWNFREAFPYKWTGPELRADASEVAFESLELAHRGLQQVAV